MAETPLSVSIREVVVTLTDGTRTYSPNFGDGLGGAGTISFTFGKPAKVESTNPSGDVVSVRSGGRTARSNVTLNNVTVRDFGEHATDVTMMDFVTQAGVVSSTWTTVTGTGADGSRVIPSVEAGERKRFKLTVVISNRSSGALKGHTLTWDDVDIEGDPEITFPDGKCLISSLVWESTQMAPTVVRTT